IKKTAICQPINRPSPDTGSAGTLILDIQTYRTVIFLHGTSQAVLVVKNPSASAGDRETWLDPWVRKIPWRRAWQPTPVFLPGESHGKEPEYIIRNTGLEEAQAGIKIARRNINNLSYADDTTLMAESEEELKRLLMKVKEESEKVGLKLNIQKMKIMASG
uniref:Uncharacterized protein n=1 Tax=Ovis aries TaxID=9940 RepID=A0AC11DI30_SHEEP